MQSDSYYDEYWNKGIGNWSPADLELTRDEVRFVDAHVQCSSSVLEIGCGDGRFGVHLRARGTRYVGLDVSCEAVQRARRRGLDAHTYDACGPLPRTLGEFDIVMCFEVLEHLFRPDEAALRVRTMLKPGGAFIGSVPNVAFLPNRFTLALGVFSAGGSPATSVKAPWRDPHIRFFTRSTLANMLRTDGGFSSARVYGGGFCLTDLPLLYRSTGWTHRVLASASSPFRCLGFIAPSMFSNRLYFVARGI